MMSYYNVILHIILLFAETLNTNSSNMATPETRLRRLKGAPADTLRLP